jgi:hypothetical protein
MGFARRLVRKSVRKATPRSVRRAMHPVRTVKHSVTPRPVKQMSRAMYTVTNPLGAAENKVIGAALSGSGKRSAGRQRAVPRTAQATATQSATAGGVRAAEAAQSADRLAQLMAVQRERFADVQRPVIPAPAAVDAGQFIEAEWARRKAEAPWWQRAKRRQLRAEVEQYARSLAADAHSRAQREHQEQQAAADAWWNALHRGEPAVVTAALKAAFSDNLAPVVVVGTTPSAAALTVLLPGMQVLPEKMAHTTPTGKLSSKAWPKTQLNEVYADLLGAHLLATIREAWAVAPSLANLRIIGVRRATEARLEALFDVEVSRADGHWHDDTWGTVVLSAREQQGLNRFGQSAEVRPWPHEKLRADVLPLLRS